MDRSGDIGTISGKYRDLEHKIRGLFENEYDKYIQERTEFYNNPYHWSNNKRRIHGLCTLRGNVNKFRSKKFPSFRINDYIFDFVTNIMDECIGNKILKSLNYFAGINDVYLGDKDFVCNFKQEEV